MDIDLDQWGVVFITDTEPDVEYQHGVLEISLIGHFYAILRRYFISS